MALALLAANVLAAIGLIWTVISGFLLGSGSVSYSTHFVVAFVSTVVALFAHSMTMFFFIGIHKILKDTAAERGFEDELQVVSRTHAMKMRTSPRALAAMVFIIVAFVIGGGIGRSVPVWMHGAAAVVALALHFLALARETRSLVENNALINEVEERAAAMAGRAG